MSGEHMVTLPYPDETEPSVGSCKCGWTIVYGWGQHTEATDEGEAHIRDASRAEPYTLERFGAGTRWVHPGRSL